MSHWRVCSYAPVHSGPDLIPVPRMRSRFREQCGNSVDHSPCRLERHDTLPLPWMASITHSSRLRVILIRKTPGVHQIASALSPAAASSPAPLRLSSWPLWFRSSAGGQSYRRDKSERRLASDIKPGFLRIRFWRDHLDPRGTSADRQSINAKLVPKSLIPG